MAARETQLRTLLNIIQKSDDEGKDTQISNLCTETGESPRAVRQNLIEAETHDLITESDGLYHLTDLGKQFLNTGVELKNIYKLDRHPAATGLPSKIAFSWGEVPITRENIAGTDYQIGVVETRGRGGMLAKRKEAESKGYTLLSKMQLQMLPQIKPYMTNEVVDVEKAAAETGIPKSKILSCVEALHAAGRDIIPKQVPYVPQQRETKPEIETPTRQQDELDNLLEKYKAGQEQSYKTMEYITDMLKQKDTKINNLEKRIGDLEKLIKK